MARTMLTDIKGLTDAELLELANETNIEICLRGLKRIPPNKATRKRAAREAEREQQKLERQRSWHRFDKQVDTAIDRDAS